MPFVYYVLFFFQCFIFIAIYFFFALDFQNMVRPLSLSIPHLRSWAFIDLLSLTRPSPFHHVASAKEQQSYLLMHRNWRDMRTRARIQHVSKDLTSFLPSTDVYISMNNAFVTIPWYLPSSGAETRQQSQYRTDELHLYTNIGKNKARRKKIFIQ